MLKVLTVSSGLLATSLAVAGSLLEGQKQFEVPVHRAIDIPTDTICEVFASNLEVFSKETYIVMLLNAAALIGWKPMSVATYRYGVICCSHRPLSITFSI